MAYISFIATFLRFPFLFMLDFQNMSLSSIGYILINFFPDRIKTAHLQVTHGVEWLYGATLPSLSV